MFSSAEKYFSDVEKDNRPQILWSSVKQDEHDHLKMLGEELVPVRNKKLE